VFGLISSETSSTTRKNLPINHILVAAFRTDVCINDFFQGWCLLSRCAFIFIWSLALPPFDFCSFVFGFRGLFEREEVFRFMYLLNCFLSSAVSFACCFIIV